MNTFWVMTFIDHNDQIRRHHYDDEDQARDFFYSTPRPLFLDEVTRHETRI